MENVYFNAWQKEFKDPFGAVAENTEVKFTVKADFIVKELSLVITKEGQKTEELPMSHQAGNFTCRYRTTQGQGLYFYHFKFIIKDLLGETYTKYLGRGEFGGIGVVCEKKEQVSQYQLTCFSKAEVPPAWYRSANFYQIFPDRFYNGNPDGQVNHPKKNTFIYGTKQDDPMYIKDAEGRVVRWDFFGGNLQGIRQKITYLKELGINAIYLNPIFESRSNHRYDTADYLAIDQILGTEKDFTDLVEALHSEGFHVILDGVFSHVGRHSRYFNYDADYGKKVGACQDPISPYYSWFTFTDYPTGYKSWWNIRDLPEVNKGNPAFQQFIYGDQGVLAKWNGLGIDGWRIDVADELPDEFITGLRKKNEEYPEKILVGEVWEDASNKVSYGVRREYILGDQLQGVMNYPFREGTIALLQGQISPQHLAEAFTRLQENYPREVFHNNFNNIGTHDTERILTMLEEDPAKLSLAFALLVLFPGVPCVYYGDEAGLTGGKDPENRKYFPWDQIDSGIYASCQKWLKLRQRNQLLQDGDFALLYSEKLLGVLRYDQQNFILTIINPTDQAVLLKIADFQALISLPLEGPVFGALMDGKSIKAKDTAIFQGSF